MLKSTSGSGNNIVVHDKRKLNVEETRDTVEKWMKEQYFIAYGEWHYQKIEPSIIVEGLLNDGVNFVPADYKFFCFNHIDHRNAVGCIAVDLDRFNGHKRLMFDNQWNYLNRVRFGFDNEYDPLPEKPELFDEMCEAATRLARPFPHCRIDFFVLNQRFYIGEITFLNGAGYDEVTPLEYSRLMGSWIALPEKKA